ncbi:hypothetical protein N752_20600 [Desulforamulus aquiferis]|nr:hypothetical protein N752_20600 [Desulforamulus aquiferis]
MLARARTTLYEGIREFLVVETDNRVIAAGSLHVLWDDLAEIRAWQLLLNMLSGAWVGCW